VLQERLVGLKPEELRSVGMHWALKTARPDCTARPGAIDRSSPRGFNYTAVGAMGVETSVLWDIVEEHLDEAAFLLQNWLAAARSCPATSKASSPRTGSDDPRTFDPKADGKDPGAD
jgi:hypothetical protein